MIYHETILQVRAPAANFYVLRAEDGLYLLDGGFIGGGWLLDRALRHHGWRQEPIRGIIVTHGHLDHILNIARLAEQSGAWVAAPILDREHYAGCYPYRGIARVCGSLEAVGRVLLGYREFKVDRWLEDGSELAVWRGLTAVHLPGHTDGHLGFYCEDLRLLFCADLFASFGRIAHQPPAIFNSCPDKMPDSLEKALSLDLAGVLPNHGDKALPAEHLTRLRKLRRKLSDADAKVSP